MELDKLFYGEIPVIYLLLVRSLIPIIPHKSVSEWHLNKLEINSRIICTTLAFTLENIQYHPQHALTTTLQGSINHRLCVSI